MNAALKWMTALEESIRRDEAPDSPYRVREECRTLHGYVRHAWPHVESAPFIDSWHIGCMAEHLLAVTAGQIQNLLINIPPGCSKSLMTCVMWPTWEWRLDPSVRWFFSSYDQQLATRDSVKCRTLVASPWYARTWGRIAFKKDQDQKTYYETVRGGYRLATSIGGHGTGEHPDRIVVDDPHNVRKAESETDRQNVVDWWDLTMPTRGLSRGARRVVIMQRLHHRDLSGHILASKGDFVHLCLPMRYEPRRMTVTPLGFTDPRTAEGELLTPRQFPEEAVAKLEKSLGPYGVAGQLQQRPQPRGGGLFKPQYFARRARAAPREAVRVRYIDRAATADSGCYTAMVLMARTPDGTLYVEDVVHGQWEPNERNDRIVAVAKRDRLRYGPRHEPTVVVEMERGSTGLESFQRLAARLQGHRVKEDRPTGSKDVRAEPWADQLAAGNVVICDGGQGDGTGAAAWDVDGYIQEHLVFQPDATSKRLGRFKDQVDASSGAANWLAAHGQATPEMKVVAFRSREKRKHPTLIVCPTRLLPALEAEQRAVLVTFADPGEEPVIPEHHLTALLEHFCCPPFADLDPDDHQDTWNDPVPPWGKPAAELVMTREHGKRFWAWLLKRRDPSPELWVFAGDDRRPDAAAKAVADVLGIPRQTLHYADPDNGEGQGKDPPANAHVYAIMKAARGMLM